MKFPKEAYINNEEIKGDFETTVISEEALENKVREYYIGNTKVAEGRRNDVRQLLEKKVIGRIGKKGKYLVDKLFELIEGIYIIQKLDKETGNVKFYKRAPDLNAIIYALDRVLGKPKQVNVQASFSLAKLLVETGKGFGDDGRGGDVDNSLKQDNGNRPVDNEKIPEFTPVFR